MHYLRTKRERMGHDLPEDADICGEHDDSAGPWTPFSRLSGAGAPKLDPEELGDVAGLRVAVVAAQWHAEVIDGLLEGTHRALKEAGLEAALVLRVPGAFELPVAARRLAASHDAVVALGVVVRGGTPHFEYVCQAATLGLTQVTVETGVPVGFGLLTCDNRRPGLRPQRAARVDRGQGLRGRAGRGPDRRGVARPPPVVAGLALTGSGAPRS